MDSACILQGSRKLGDQQWVAGLCWRSVQAVLEVWSGSKAGVTAEEWRQQGEMGGGREAEWSQAASRLRLANGALEGRHQKISPWLGEKSGRAVPWGLTLNPRGWTSVWTHHMGTSSVPAQSVWGRGDKANEDRCCTWRDVCSCFH